MTQSQDLTGVDARHLAALLEITRTITSSLEFDDVLNTVIDSIMRVMRAQRGFLMITDETTGDLRIQVARGVDGTDLASDESYSRTVVRQAVQMRQTLLTNNAQYDFQSGQSVIMRGLRAILCAPMLVQDRLIGVVYVDTALRSGLFTESDQKLMDAVAGQAGVAIENARLYRVAVEKGRLERELQMAREIQESLLPRQIPGCTGYEIAARWRSAREVAGDFYDIFTLPSGAVGLVIADVSDKGAPAALMMAAVRSIIRSHALSDRDLLSVLQLTNRQMALDAENGMFVSAFYSVLHPDGQSAHVCAGHPPPILYRAAENRFIMLPRGGMALGWFEENPLRVTSLMLYPGDILVYFTDGLSDAENDQGEFFDLERLIHALQTRIHLPAQEIADGIIADVDQFCGSAWLADDLTLCVVRRTDD
jgi:sigma-B regulation protein RsbU (phosphoserine phosphatase)